MKDKLIGSLITVIVVFAAAAAVWAIFFRPTKFDTTLVKKSDLQEVVSETGTVISNHVKSYYTEQDTRILTVHNKVGNKVEYGAALVTVEYPGGADETPTIAAEFAGVLSDILVEEGALVPAGTKLFTLADHTDLAVTLLAGQSDLDKLALSQAAEITLGDHNYKGTVTKISGLAAAASGKPKVAVTIKITKPDQNILLGEETDVEIYTKSKESALVVPSEAVYSDADHDFVYVIEDSKVLRKIVTVGISSKSLSEISEGLVAGDVVITGTVTDSDRGKRAVSS